MDRVNSFLLRQGMDNEERKAVVLHKFGLLGLDDWTQMFPRKLFAPKGLFGYLQV